MRNQAIPLHVNAVKLCFKALDCNGGRHATAENCGCVVEGTTAGKANGEGLGEGEGGDVCGKGVRREGRGG